MARLEVTQVRSALSRQQDQGRTLRALGLHRIGDSVEIEERPELLGMVRKVSHLVRVKKVGDPHEAS